MTPGARIQATIDIIEQLLRSWQESKRFPADKMIDQYFKGHRYIGSKDRAAVGELAYWVLRHKAELEWHCGERDRSARMLVLAALILRREYNPQSIVSISKDSKYSPAALTEAELSTLTSVIRHPSSGKTMPDHCRLNYPEWMEEELRDSFGHAFEAALLALNEQAPTDLRANTLKTTRDDLVGFLQKGGFDCVATNVSPVGIRLAKRAPIFTSPLFKTGNFEVQDEGSQIVALLTDAKPGDKVIDFCAGAGGKTLAIAAEMKNKGRILAWDTSEKRLSQMSERLRRAGVDNVQKHVIESENDPFIKRHKASADRVLVDAPCSGTGTWRRNPDLKWRFTPQDLQEVLAVQRAILTSAARLVKPGGRLIYATCSVLKSENDRQIAQFLKDISNFRVVCAQKIWDKAPASYGNEEASFLSVAPHTDGVDGFFAAILERI